MNRSYIKVYFNEPISEASLDQLTTEVETYVSAQGHDNDAVYSFEESA